jgi:chorismate--pyruvate lyase
MPISPGLRSWLFEAGSLTRRLARNCGERFSLRLVSSAWGPPLPDERQALRLAAGRAALVRQVYLLCDGRPLVFARSVIPPRSLLGKNRRLTRLGSRPLAGLLFGHRPVDRDVLEVAALSPGHPLHALACHDLGPRPAGTLWARRSVFYPARKPVLVTEVFLPDIAGLR